MTVEINATQGFIYTQVTTERARKTGLSDIRPAERSSEESVKGQRSSLAPSANSEPFVGSIRADAVRQLEAAQELEKESLRLRKDDNSDLNFRAKVAVNRFIEVSDHERRQEVSELLGVDLFA
jgi:hypothetical protein